MATVVERLDARMRQAFAHPMFNELRRQIPPAEQNDPRMLAAWLSAAAGLDPKGAKRAPFAELRDAVDKWGAASDLVDRAVRLYHDPRAIALAGDKRDYYL